MELDELKNIWQQTQTETVYQENLDNESITSITQQKSKTISDKLYQNLRFDMAVSCLFILPLMYLVLGTGINIHHKIIALFFLVLTCTGIVFYSISQRQYQDFSSKNDVVSTLKFTIDKFRKQIKTIRILNNLLLLPLIFYGVVVAAEITEIETNLRELIILALLISPIAYFYNQFLIKTLYSNHLEKLKKHLNELEIQA